jgi:hypothetical protein
MVCHCCRLAIAAVASRCGPKRATEHNFRTALRTYNCMRDIVEALGTSMQTIRVLPVMAKAGRSHLVATIPAAEPLEA